MRLLATAAACFEKQAARELGALLQAQLGRASDLVDTKAGRMYFSLPDDDDDNPAHHSSALLPLLCSSLQCVEHLFVVCLEAKIAHFSDCKGGGLSPQLVGEAAAALPAAVYEAATRARAAVVAPPGTLLRSTTAAGLQPAPAPAPEAKATTPTFYVSVRAGKQVKTVLKRAVAAAVADGVAVATGWEPATTGFDIELVVLLSGSKASATVTSAPLYKPLYTITGE